MKRNITPLISIILGFGVVFFGIMDSGGNIMMFISTSSLLIVLGGALAALGIIYSVNDLKKIPKLMSVLLSDQTEDLVSLIKLFEELSIQSRREGILALDSKVSEIDDYFLKKGIQLVVDGAEAEEITQTLTAEIEALDERHSRNQGIMTKLGVLTPGFGMIGTVIGLIIMLGNLSTDPEELGAGMATALITTFYGSVFSNLIFDPIATNLRLKTDQEILYREIMLKGILFIQSGANPRVLKENLITYLSPDQRVQLENSENDHE